MLEASTGGSVTVVSPGVSGSSSNTKPSAAADWGETQAVGIGTVDALASGPDGSAVAVSTGVCSELSCIRASYRSAGGAWGGQETVAITSGSTVTGLAVAANPAAFYTVVWGQLSGTVEPVPPGDVFASDRAPGPGGSWSAPPRLVANLPADQPGCSFGCFDLATGADGTQLAVWQQTGDSGNQIAAALRSAGGDWSGPERASGTVDGNGAPFAAITTSGVPVVAWSSNADNSADANGSHRDTAGDWQPVKLGASQDDSVNLGDLDPDGDGNALTAFRHRGGAFTVGFDGGGPRFSSFSIPAGGTVGQSLAFSAAADDNWSSVKAISWLFGDSTGANGGSVGHAYGAAGSYVATARATDTLDNVTEQSGPVGIAASATPPPPLTRAARPTPTRTGSRTAATTTTAPSARARSRPSTRPSSPAMCS